MIGGEYPESFLCEVEELPIEVEKPLKRFLNETSEEKHRTTNTLNAMRLY